MKNPLHRKRLVIGLGFVGLAMAWFALWTWNEPQWIKVDPMVGPKVEGSILVSLQRDFARVDQTPEGGPHYTPSFASTVRIDPAAGSSRSLFDRMAIYARVSPDGKWLGYLTDSQEVMLRSVAGGDPSPCLAWPGLASVPVWAPDSRSFLCGDDGSTENGTWRVDVPGLKRTRIYLPKSHIVHDWSSDGRWLMTASRTPDQLGCDLFRTGLDGSIEVKLASGGYNTYPRISPDGSKVVYTNSVLDAKGARWAGTIGVVNSDGTGTRKLADGFQHGSQASWSPDGRTLLIKSFINLSLIDLDGSNRRPIPLQWKSRQPMFALPPSLGGPKHDARWIGAVEWTRNPN